MNNFSSLGQARQSSTSAGGVASRAIDGNTNPNYFEGNSVTHTASEASPWWEVEFPHPLVIFEIVVYNRAGDASFRILDFVLTVFHDGEVIYDSSVIDPDKSKTDQPMYTFFAPDHFGIFGDKVKIHLPSGPEPRVLSLAEVEVYSVYVV